MTASITLPLVDGARVVVPDSLQLITPYVLREQQDWFEDEIKFLRRLLQPGQQVIDIGANYGVYTLSMAQAVGPSGRVWCFEPASGTAAFLAQGIAANGFAHVVLERSALSCAPGTARLSLHDNSELNELVRGTAPVGATETVTLTTLDECQARYGWQDIAFLKMDAEGEEANILKGGTRFLAECSPLIEYEVKAGNDLHLELVTAFAALGYRSYRLVPGLDVLVPFRVQGEQDPFLLNLFCCKDDRAAQLAAAGFLVTDAALAATAPPADLDRYHWRQTLAALPYGQALRGQWEATVRKGQSGEVETALALYACSQDATRPAAERFASLEAGFNRLKNLCQQNAAGLRAASLARVARAYGARGLATNVLAQLTNGILARGQLDPGEPFLLPVARFDTLAPGQQLGNWVLAALLEGLERFGAFSSFYTGPHARQRLELIRNMGFGDAEMQRRLELVTRRFGPG